jgi:hypothetical protein
MQREEVALRCEDNEPTESTPPHWHPLRFPGHLGTSCGYLKEKGRQSEENESRGQKKPTALL